ncbi:hypothetical protein BHE74_00022189 [Ensete ventricosum]|nr:hypothetical protein BHE74_00022189 [Ensete ventricosum]
MVNFSLQSIVDGRNRPSTVDFWRNRLVASGPCTGNLADRVDDKVHLTGPYRYTDQPSIRYVLEALDVLRKKSDAQAEEIVTIEKLVADAYSAIDKAVQVGTLHRNTGARRKSRLARRKKAVEIHHGWYIPAAAGAAA